MHILRWMVLKLLEKKTWYVSWRSPWQWYKKFDQFITKNSYTRNHFDNCVYFKTLKDCSLPICSYVLKNEDILIASKSKVEIKELKVLLKSEFEMKDLGEGKKILSIEITIDRWWDLDLVYFMIIFHLFLLVHVSNCWMKTIFLWRRLVLRITQNMSTKMVYGVNSQHYKDLTNILLVWTAL